MRQTSSPSLRNLGALTKAKLSVLSSAGFWRLVRTNVSPERTFLTFACFIPCIFAAEKEGKALQILFYKKGVQEC